MKNYESYGFKRYLAIFPTWRCNLKCPYCAYRPQGDYVDVYRGLSKIPMNEVAPDIWVNFLKGCANTLIDICGGEPLLYKELHKILDSLPASSKYAMTSNTTLFNQIFDLNPEKCLCWTASYHPSAPSPYSNIDWFLETLVEMKRYGFRHISCTIVYLPWKYTLQDMELFRKKVSNRIKLESVTWQPYSWPGYKWSCEKMEIAKKMYPQFKLDWEKRSQHKVCDAGINYISVNSDGMVYRCLSHLTFNGIKLGNISGDWSSLEKRTECFKPCVYPCDYLNVECLEKNGIEESDDWGAS